MTVTTPIWARGRRVFLLKVMAASASAVGVARHAVASEKIDPTDPYARSMGFVLNTKEVDQTRYPRHTPDQSCSGCKLWNGGDQEFGNCSFFDGAISPKTGWCKNFKLPKAPAT